MMKKKPVISIITPVYNTSKYLIKCIQSIINQSFFEWELILVNDGSADDSLNICVKFSQEHDNIKVFSQENRGVSAARNLGMLNAVGKYLCFIDSDDWVDKDYLITFLKSTEENAMVVQDYKKILDNEIKVVEHVNGYHNIQFSLPKDLNLIIKEYRYTQGYLFNKIFERELIVNNSLVFVDSITMGEDEIFYQKYLQLIGKLKFVGADHYNYVERKNSLTTKHAKFESEFLYCLECNKFYHYILKNDSSVDNVKFFQDKFSRNFNHILRTIIYWSDYPKKERILFLKKMHYSYKDSFQFLKPDTILKKIDYFLFKAKLFRLLDSILVFKKKIINL
ncbi:Glycosyltransferase involved in cell wall bisynthesis [Epilithonimonas bovis DSM 19482]|uniref:Glycosyltransferase involved in cell wall bisynthesis n=1 Tax=Epilithonimonas bovis DSM 19482 TaxID=1121284 RepID=A0A1U7PZN4_9FLAO|nr:glycosyltransferase [Epilithonimonas bovis]SIT97391.1 Glycosyltransferase involved in cell wall bisynthesis [Epilithonimonas bovis DSM 19482]